MKLLRSDARFCSTKCRVYYSRRPKLPEKMAQSRRFVRYTARKVPFSVTGAPASSTNSETWASYDDAKASTVGAGLGFVLGDGVGCIDLDHCFAEGELAPWAAEIVAANHGTFMEVSMSGEGLHIFGLLPEGPGRKIREDQRSIEVYSRGRYIALTLNTFDNAPATLRPLILPGIPAL
jgi:primase-polymerase (primpol)-like protein